METSILKKATFFLLLALFLLYSCKKDKLTTPSLTTNAVTEISYTTAISGGNLTNDGGTTILSQGVCWNTSSDPTFDNNRTTEELGIGAFTSNLTLLSPNTLYYVRAYATNGVGTGYGNQVTFTTNQITTPVITTVEITSITNSSAISGGSITTDNGGAVVARGVIWSTSENPSLSDSKTSDGSGNDNFVSTLFGLIGNTKYYVRAYATNSAGTSYGNQLSFVTTSGPPSLTSFSISSFTANSCIIKGSVLNDGGAPVTARGVCYSTSHYPTTSDNKTSDGTGTGSYISYLTGLQQNTTYYARPYAVSSVGVQYGNEVSVKTLEMITDVVGTIYNVTSIGSQVWMTENLKTTKYNDNTDITLNTTNSFWSYTNTTPGYCWYNNNEITYKNTYGALYNWYAVNTGKLCPFGWHIPTDNDWITLITFVGGENLGGTTLKESGNTHWSPSGTSSNNEFSFTALPGGERYNTFTDLGLKGTYWSNTVYDFQNSYSVVLAYNYWGVSRYTYHKSTGLSVRCIKD